MRKEKKIALAAAGILTLGTLVSGLDSKANVASGSSEGDTLLITAPATTDVEKLCGPGVVERDVDPNHCNDGVEPVKGRLVD